VKGLYQKYNFMLWISGTIIVLDQWTKWLIRSNLPVGATWLPEWLDWLSPYARFVHWHNTGAAFGMFQGGSMVFTLLAFLVIGAIIYYFPQVDRKDWFLRVALSMQLAGAIGNLIDRLTQNGRVTDFISVGTFPVFNVADASISVGTAVLLLGVYLQERALHRSKAGPGDSNPASEAASE
jgi:signal peptidase II